MSTEDTTTTTEEETITSIDGPAQVGTGEPQEDPGDICLIFWDGLAWAGQTNHSFQPCGPSLTTTTTIVEVATGTPPVHTLPATGTATAGMGIGAALMILGGTLLLRASARR